jgi:hypothetical protein
MHANVKRPTSGTLAVFALQSGRVDVELWPHTLFFRDDELAAHVSWGADVEWVLWKNRHFGTKYDALSPVMVYAERSCSH